jgi:hypothetical protein
MHLKAFKSKSRCVCKRKIKTEKKQNIYFIVESGKNRRLPDYIRNIVKFIKYTIIFQFCNIHKCLAEWCDVYLPSYSYTCTHYVNERGGGGDMNPFGISQALSISHITCKCPTYVFNFVARHRFWVHISHRENAGRISRGFCLLCNGEKWLP